MPELRINGIVPESVVDGPGLRFVVFTQGCPHACPGCHNPETHDPSGGRMARTEDLLEEFSGNPLLSGITFSGGEPFQQPEPLSGLARQVKARGKTVLVYTGYTLEHLIALGESNSAINDLLSQIDMLVDGPYLENLRDLDLDFRGSSNQRVLNKADIRKIHNTLSLN